MRNLLSYCSALLGAAMLVACGGGDTFEIEIVSNDPCNGLNIIEPAHIVSLSVRGPGMSTVTAESTGSDGSVEVPDVPEGKDRVVVVEVWSSSGGRKVELRARGESEPFDVTADGAPRVRVVLYRTNYFAEVVGKNGACTKMKEARAGHISAPLSKYEVLVAGGYTNRKEGKLEGILSSAEVFDFRAGTFRSVAPMPAPRALARAVPLADGRVLVIGGVRQDGDSVVPVDDAAIFDGKAWKTVQMASARRDFTATRVSRTGEILVVGGVDAEGQIVRTIEAFDPTTDSFREVELAGGADSFARAYHAAVAQGTDNVVVIGGIDADGKMLGDASILTWDTARQAYLAQVGQYTLNQPVIRPGAMLLGTAAGPRLVLAGGNTQYVAIGGEPGNGAPGSETRLVQYLDPLNGTSRGEAEMNWPVAESCAIALDATRGLVVGGTRSTGAAASPADLGEFLRLQSGVVSVARAGESGDRRIALQHLSCSPVGENAVLVTGGYTQEAKATGLSLIYLLRPDANQG